MKQNRKDPVAFPENIQFDQSKTTSAYIYIYVNSLMEHDRFLHTTKREECNVSLHVCGDFN